MNLDGNYSAMVEKVVNLGLLRFLRTRNNLKFTFLHGKAEQLQSIKLTLATE